jgi:hypothetical protein
MTKDEALKGAIGAEYQKSPWDGKGISMPPPEAPVQEPVAGQPLPCPFCGHIGLDFSDGETYRWGVASCGGCGASCGDVRREYPDQGEWHTEAIAEWNRRSPAAPDLQAELDATNRQVEILSDALAESRRGVAALAAPVHKPLHPEIKKLYEDYFDKCFRESSAAVPENFMDALMFDTAVRDVDAMIALARSDERESCAKVCDRMAARCNDIRAAALESAAENIRARGNI